MIEEQAAIAETAAREAQAMVAKYPSGRDRRLRLMLIILAVLVVWMVMMHLLMPKLH